MLVAIVALSIILATHNTASGQKIAKHRLIVITDIGNEPDDFMSMVRLMLYTNQIDGILSVFPGANNEVISNDWKGRCV